MPSYAVRSYENMFKALADYDSPVNPSGNRPVIGTSPPKSTGTGDQWVMTGNVRVGSSNPKSGSSWSTIPIWSKTTASANTQASKQDQGPPAPAASTQTPSETEARTALETRKDAYNRAQQFQADTAAIPRTPAPSDPLAKDFYSSMNAYGRAYVDDYLKGQETEKRRVELGVDENAYFANQSLRNINPATMNISKADTQDDTLDFLKQLRSLIS